MQLNTSLLFLLIYTIYASSSSQPKSAGSIIKGRFAQIVVEIASSAIPVAILSNPFIARALPAIADVNLVQDTLNRYSIKIPPSFTIVKRNVPPVTMASFQPEAILLAASSFTDVPGSPFKGASISVTRTDARRLLKDFNVEWWFGPIEKMTDLGSAQLIAELLVLQRQGEFESKKTVSSLESASIDSSGQLAFSFLTPLNATNLKRRTAARAVLRNQQLIVAWVSSLEKFWTTDNAAVFDGVVASLELI